MCMIIIIDMGGMFDDFMKWGKWMIGFRPELNWEKYDHEESMRAQIFEMKAFLPMELSRVILDFCGHGIYNEISICDTNVTKVCLIVVQIEAF